LKAVLIGAVATLGLALIITLSLLWVRSSSKKERAVRKYTEVKKQVDPSASKSDVFITTNFHYQQKKKSISS